MLEDLPKAWVAMGHEDVRAFSRTGEPCMHGGCLGERERCAADMLVLATKPK